MPTTTRHPDAPTTDATGVRLPDALFGETKGVLDMLRRVTVATNLGDTAALVAEMSAGDGMFAWDGDGRIRGASAVARFVTDHRALVPGADIEFAPPRVVFEEGHAWAWVDWAWSVSAGEAVCRLVREDGRWRIAAMDPTGALALRPDADFDPRSAARALAGAVSFLELLDGALRAGADHAMNAARREPLYAMVTGRGALGRANTLARLVELSGRLERANTSVAVSMASGRALVLVEGDGDTRTALHMRRAGADWRLCAVELPSRDTTDASRPASSVTNTTIAEA